MDVQMIQAEAEQIRAKVLAAWLQRIHQAMETQKASAARFVMGKDFQASELPWIRAFLIPTLNTPATGFSADLYFAGTNSGCDCYGSPCYHCDGRELVVRLKGGPT